MPPSPKQGDSLGCLAMLVATDNQRLLLVTILEKSLPVAIEWRVVMGIGFNFQNRLSETNPIRFSS